MRPSSLNGRLMTGGAVGRTAALAEAALIQRQRRLAAGHDLARKVAVAAVDGLLVARILRTAQRDMHARGVTLQADDQRQLALISLRQHQVAAHVHVLLAREDEANLSLVLFLVRPLDAEVLLAPRQRQAQHLSQARAGLLLPGGEILALLIAISRLDILHQIQMSYLRIQRHTHSSLCFRVVNRLHYSDSEREKLVRI